MKNLICIIFYLVSMFSLSATDNKEIMLSNIRYSNIGRPDYLIKATASYIDSIRNANMEDDSYNEEYLSFLKFEPYYQDYSLLCLIWPYMKDPVTTSFIVSKGEQIQIYKTLESYLNTILSIESSPTSDTLISMLSCWFKRYEISSLSLSIQGASIPYCWVKTNQSNSSIICRSFEWITNTDTYENYSLTGKINYPINHSKCTKRILPKAKYDHNETLIRKWQQFAYGHNCKYLFYELFHNETCQIGLIESKYKRGYAYTLIFVDEEVCCFELEDSFNYYFDVNGIINIRKCEGGDYVYLIEKILFSNQIRDNEKLELIEKINMIRNSIRQYH